MSSYAKIWLSSPHMGNAEMNFIKDAFESNWIAPVGPNIIALEEDIIAFTAAKHAVVLCSGTAAIHLGLIQLGVKAGDEVICQSFTFSAAANPILYQGASPIFVDSERNTWNMSPVCLEQALSDRLKLGKLPKAIVVVHSYGMPAIMQDLMEVAQKYGIPILEDAADALGATYHGKACGTFGAIGVLSFNGNKIITTSGGGALISDTEEYVTKARFLATQARDDAPHYQHSHIGYNYRMSNVSAGIGRGQMLVLKDRIAQRRANFDFYVNALGHLPGISFVHEAEGSFSNRWLTTILVDPVKSGGVSREIIRLALELQNIESRPLWKPMHLQPIFADAPFYGDGTSEKLFEQGLCLPSGSNLTPAELDRVVTHIKALFI